MTNTTNPTGRTTAPEQLASIWGHLDLMLTGDCVPLLDIAAESVETVQAALLTGKPVNAGALAALLGHVARDIRNAHSHLGHAIVELADLDYHQ